MGPIIDDLRIEAESPPGHQRPGASVTVTLQFFNTGDDVRRLFFIGAENLRFGQSTFRFRPRAWPTQIQPIPREGYLPREDDFHELAPRGRLTFTQTLHLARNIPHGDLAVEWLYENKIESWPKAMFNAGELIPGIWRGSISHSFKVRIART